MFQVSDLFGISVDTLCIYRLLNLSPYCPCMVNYPQSFLYIHDNSLSVFIVLGSCSTNHYRRF